MKHNIMYKINDYVIPIYRRSIGSNYAGLNEDDIEFVNNLSNNTKILLSGRNGRVIKENGWINYQYELIWFVNGKETTVEDYFDVLSDDDKTEWVFHLDELDKNNMWKIAKAVDDVVLASVKERAKGSQSLFRRVS